MDWTFWPIGLGAAALFIFLRRTGLIGEEPARALLKEGAEIVDVRNESEFRSGHVPGAINIPLGELSSSIERFVPDKNTPLLLHCLSGGRSALGRRVLRAKGYQRVYNLGSYSRAGKIAASASAK